MGVSLSKGYARHLSMITGVPEAEVGTYYARALCHMSGQQLVQPSALIAVVRRLWANRK